MFVATARMVLGAFQNCQYVLRPVVQKSRNQKMDLPFRHSLEQLRSSTANREGENKRRLIHSSGGERGEGGEGVTCTFLDYNIWYFRVFGCPAADSPILEPQMSVNYDTK